MNSTDLLTLTTQRQAALDAWKEYQDAINKPIGLTGTDTGFNFLNLNSGGHVATKITTLAQRSGGGKSASLVNLMRGAGRVLNGKRSELLILSWEMNAQNLTERYVCSEAGVTIAQLRYPRTLDDYQKELVKTAHNTVSKLPVHYHLRSTNIKELMPVLDKFLKICEDKSRIEGVKIQPVIALDYIGRIKGSSRYNSKTYDIEEFLVDLKQYLNVTGAAAYILAQILRSADGKDAPEVSDVKDSSSIEENSDTLILAHRPEYYGKMEIVDPLSGSKLPSRNKMLMRIVKARESFPHDLLVNCDMRYFRIWDLDHVWEYEYFKDYEKESFWKSKFNL